MRVPRFNFGVDYDLRHRQRAYELKHVVGRNGLTKVFNSLKIIDAYMRDLKIRIV